MKTVIKLTKENIERWKYVLDSCMKKRVRIENYSSTCSDQDWLDLFEGQTPIDVFYDYCTTD